MCLLALKEHTLQNLPATSGPLNQLKHIIILLASSSTGYATALGKYSDSWVHPTIQAFQMVRASLTDMLCNL